MPNHRVSNNRHASRDLPARRDRDFYIYTDEDFGSNAGGQGDWNQRTRNTPSFNSGAYNSPHNYEQPSNEYGENIFYGHRSQPTLTRPMGQYSGIGPKGYRRSDERIKEEICDMLTHDSSIDASDIVVSVKEGEVTLAGTILDKQMKRMTEQVVDCVQGVTDIQNQLKIKKLPH